MKKRHLPRERLSGYRPCMNAERLDRFLRSWVQNAGALLLCLFVGAKAVESVERAGYIYTTAWHTAWVTAVLFLSYLAFLDMRRGDASTEAEPVDAGRDK